MPPRPTKLSDPQKELAAALAAMGMTQPEIAKRLVVVQGSVSRALKELANPKRPGGPLLRREEYVWLGDPAELPRLAYRRELDELNGFLAEVADAERGAEPDAGRRHELWPGHPHAPPVIYPFYSNLCRVKSPKPADWCRTLPEWAGVGVAAAIRGLLVRQPCPAPRTVGVGWGRQIRAVCDAIRLLRPQADTPLEFFPLMGARNQMVCEPDDSVFTNPYVLSANELAFDFQQAVTGRPMATPHERYLPGINFIPFDDPAARHAGPAFPFEKRLTEAELREEGDYVTGLRRRLFGAFPAYRTIFGPTAEKEGPVCERLDAVIAAVGGPEAALLFGNTSHYGGVPQTWFSEHTVGDIASVHLFRRPSGRPGRRAARPETPAVAVQQYERFRRRWLGVTETQLAGCAERARRVRNGAGVGVIVLAFGADRAGVVFECLRRGLVNHLFADNTLLDALTQFARERLTTMRSPPPLSSPP